MKKIDNIKDNNILKIEQLLFGLQDTNRGKNYEFSSTGMFKNFGNNLKFQVRTKINRYYPKMIALSRALKKYRSQNKILLIRTMGKFSNFFFRCWLHMYVYILCWFWLHISIQRKKLSIGCNFHAYWRNPAGFVFFRSNIFPKKVRPDKVCELLCFFPLKKLCVN